MHRIYVCILYTLCMFVFYRGEITKKKMFGQKTLYIFTYACIIYIYIYIYNIHVYMSVFHTQNWQQPGGLKPNSGSGALS